MARYKLQGLCVRGGTAFERLLQILHVERGDQVSSLRQGIPDTQQAAMTRYRRNIRREVQKNRWHDALSAHERVGINVYLLTTAGLIARAESKTEKEKKNGLGKQAALLLGMLLCGMRIDRTQLPPSVRADATSSLEDISDNDAWTNYTC